MVEDGEDSVLLVVGVVPTEVVVQFTPFHLTVVLGTCYLVHSIRLSNMRGCRCRCQKSMDDHL